MENQNFGAGSRFLVTAAATMVVIAGLKAAQSLIIPFLIAMFLAILCAPGVAWLKARHMPTIVAVLLVVMIMVLVLTGFTAAIGGSVRGFTDSIPEYQERINSMVKSTSQWLKSVNVIKPYVKLDTVIDSVENALDFGAIMGFIGTGLKGLIAALSNTVLVVLILVFMLLEAAGMQTKIKAAVGGRGTIGRLANVTRQVQHYLAIKTALSVVTGLVITVWVAVLGLDFAVVWGLLAFLLNYIPNLGSIIAAAPAILLALVQLGPGSAILVMVGFVVVNVTIGNIIEPHLMGRRLGLSTLVVFLSLVFWGWVWGPVGMLLSVPLTMIVKILLENSEDLKWIGVMLDSGKAAEARLEAQAAVAQAAETPADETPFAESSDR